MRRHLTVVAIAALCARQLDAQAVIHTANSTIEIIGLKRWTTKMIEDSLKKYAEDDLSVHACAAVLRMKLHFADASVVNYTNFPEFGFKDYLAITVIEPADSSQVHYKPKFKDSLATRAEWADAMEAMDSNFVPARRAITAASFREQQWSASDSVRFAKLEPLHRLLLDSRTEAAFALAKRTIETDGNPHDREMAAIILANFPDHDDAWRTLADAQRDPSGRVASTATEMLSLMRLTGARRVDWTPVADQLRYIIDGTNLFALETTLGVLVATDIDPSLAHRLLAGHGTLLRSILGSGNVIARRQVCAFLAKLSGLPATSDAATFERWIDSVTANASF